MLSATLVRPLIPVNENDLHLAAGSPDLPFDGQHVVISGQSPPLVQNIVLRPADDRVNKESGAFPLRHTTHLGVPDLVLRGGAIGVVAPYRGLSFLFCLGALYGRALLVDG